ncbi:hypothetical protein L6R50_23070 [Myxococcota bacterium]|nr:hypothetical protein [Myxococcota bacterium]
MTRGGRGRRLAAAPWVALAVAASGCLPGLPRGRVVDSERWLGEPVPSGISYAGLERMEAPPILPILPFASREVEVWSVQPSGDPRVRALEVVAEGGGAAAERGTFRVEVTEPCGRRWIGGGRGEGGVSGAPPGRRWDAELEAEIEDAPGGGGATLTARFRLPDGRRASLRAEAGGHLPVGSGRNRPVTGPEGPEVLRVESLVPAEARLALDGADVPLAPVAELGSAGARGARQHAGIRAGSHTVAGEEDRVVVRVPGGTDRAYLRSTLGGKAITSRDGPAGWEGWEWERVPAEGRDALELRRVQLSSLSGEPVLDLAFNPALPDLRYALPGPRESRFVARIGAEPGLLAGRVVVAPRPGGGSDVTFRPTGPSWAAGVPLVAGISRAGDAVAVRVVRAPGAEEVERGCPEPPPAAAPVPEPSPTPAPAGPEGEAAPAGEPEDDAAPAAGAGG